METTRLLTKKPAENYIESNKNNQEDSKINRTSLKFFTSLMTIAAIGVGISATITGAVIPLALTAGVCGLISFVCWGILFKGSNQSLPIDPTPEKEAQNPIEKLKKNQSFTEEIELKDDKWDKWLNSEIIILGKIYQHSAENEKSLNNAFDLWAGDAPNKEQIIKFAKSGIIDHFFTVPYSKKELPIQAELLVNQEKDPFEYKSVKFIEGKKVQAQFEYESKGHKCHFTQTFSLSSVEGEKANVLINRSFEKK